MSGARELAEGFGALVQTYVDRKGWTHEQVAKAVWGPKGAERKSHVSRVIRGTNKPTSATIREFADALGIPDEEIEALRAREREAARAEAEALAIPLAFLDRMAELFGEDESFRGWSAYAAFMEGKAQDYARLQDEVAALAKSNPRTENRLPAIKALLAEGQIEEAEEALKDLRETATDHALDGLRQLSDIMATQADAALVRGDADEAFALYRDAAALFDQLAPREGAARRGQWGIRICQHGLRYGGPGLAHSAMLLTLNLDSFSREAHPLEWAQAQGNLAIALSNQATRTEGQPGADLLARAVAAYEALLEVFTRDAHPVDWARAQMNLGNALWAQATRAEGQSGADLLSRAVAAFEAALEVRTRDAHPVDWAMTKMNLATALSDQATRTEGQPGADLLSRAVAAYEAALEVRTRDAHPVEWAITQANLAHTYIAMSELPGENREQRLVGALAAVDGALEIFDPETMSYQHGTATRLRERILAAMNEGEGG